MTEKFDAEKAQKLIADMKKLESHWSWGWSFGRVIGWMIGVAALTGLVTGTGWMVISFMRFLNG